jgi:hypothetical protein
MAFLEHKISLYLLVFIVVTYLVGSSIYSRLLSPLSKIPGPWYAALTKWWMVYKTMKGVRAKTIHDLHLRYGPWVRIAPNEVSTCDREAIMPVYGVNSNFSRMLNKMTTVLEVGSVVLRPTGNTQERQLQDPSLDHKGPHRNRSHPIESGSLRGSIDCSNNSKPTFHK